MRGKTLNIDLYQVQFILTVMALQADKNVEDILKEIER